MWTALKPGTSSKVASDGPFEAVLGKTRRTEFSRGKWKPEARSSPPVAPSLLGIDSSSVPVSAPTLSTLRSNPLFLRGSDKLVAIHATDGQLGVCQGRGFEVLVRGGPDQLAIGELEEPQLGSVLRPAGAGPFLQVLHEVHGPGIGPDGVEVTIRQPLKDLLGGSELLPHPDARLVLGFTRPLRLQERGQRQNQRDNDGRCNGFHRASS